MSQSNGFCRGCGDALSTEVLYVGELPPCNRFQVTQEAMSEIFPLSMTQCPSCSLIQLGDVPAPTCVVPQVPWIRYNEPDAHLPEVVDQLSACGLSKEGIFYGVGPFDSPLLSKLTDDVQIIDVLPALDETGIRFPYLETIQARLDPAYLKNRAVDYVKGDLVVCRYLLEHCHEPLKALEAMQHLIHEQGLMLIEVPDATKFLRQQDYSFIWEEHITYFTEASLRQLCAHSQCEVVGLWRYAGQLEDALVVLLKPLHASSVLIEDRRDAPVAVLDESYSAFRAYVASFSVVKRHYREALAAVRARGGKTVVFGAGHQAVMFINALEIGAYVAFVIDDDQRKQGYCVPGAGSPIVSSMILLSDPTIEVCLLALSPKFENGIRQKFQAFIQRGGQMYSIFPGSHMGTILEVASCV